MLSKICDEDENEENDIEFVKNIFKEAKLDKMLLVRHPAREPGRSVYNRLLKSLRPCVKIGTYL